MAMCELCKTIIMQIFSGKSENYNLVSQSKIILFPITAQPILHCIVFSKELLLHCLFLSFQDIAAGLLLATGLVSILIPIVDQLDGVLLTSQFAPVFIITLSILVIVYHPNADKWTPTR